MANGSQVDPMRAMDALGAVLPSRGRVYIIPHNYPDPDALAAAAGMHLLLAKRYRLTGQIIFTGMVSRAENRELLRQFKYPWGTWEQESRPRRERPCVLVDTSPWSGNVTLPEFVRPVAVIDHHPVRRRRNLESQAFLDIRAGAGATCTIVYEYLKACEIAIPKWLATVMTYAIASETLDLSRDSTPQDLAAYVALLSMANLSNLGRMRHAPLPRTYYAHLQDAMNYAQVYGRVAWTFLPRVRMPEIVAEVADLLHRLERITWAFCVAEFGDRMLVSIRTSDPRGRCGRLLKMHVGRAGNAGGHHHMAAGYLEMKGMDAAARTALRKDFVQRLVVCIERRSARSGVEEQERISPQPLVEPEPKPKPAVPPESTPPAPPAESPTSDKQG
jgi:nanoRNase/pAp phosphatase (c-di-AMP/oligoRNAs hydrolase)